MEDGPLIAPTYVLLKQINPPRTRSWRRLGARPQNGKIITYNGDMYDFYAWHAAMRPLINVGKAAYLPRFNDQWEGAKVRLPQLKRYTSEDPFYVAGNAFLDLYLEQVVSQRLGFQHVLSESSDCSIVTARIALTNIPTQGTRANVSNKRGRRAHLILRLRIPSIANASFEELWTCAPALRAGVRSMDS